MEKTLLEHVIFGYLLSDKCTSSRCRNSTLGTYVSCIKWPWLWNIWAPRCKIEHPREESCEWKKWLCCASVASKNWQLQLFISLNFIPTDVVKKSCHRCVSFPQMVLMNQGQLGPLKSRWTRLRWTSRLTLAARRGAGLVVDKWRCQPWNKQLPFKKMQKLTRKNNIC